MSIVPNKNISHPISGNAGKKKTEPRMNKMFPIFVKNAIKDPTLSKGIKGLN